MATTLLDVGCNCYLCDDVACNKSWSARDLTVAFSTGDCCGTVLNGTYSLGSFTGGGPVCSTQAVFPQATFGTDPLTCPQPEATVASAACFSEPVTGGTRYITDRGTVWIQMVHSNVNDSLTIIIEPRWLYFTFAPGCAHSGAAYIFQRFTLTRSSSTSGALTLASSGSPSFGTWGGCSLTSASIALTP